ncbi:MAG: hypothetical protein ACQEP1_00415 [Nanobdellota archaeon]
MKKAIIFDTGPIINLALNNLIWLFEPLHREFRGTFYIPRAVKKELIDRPLGTKKFKLEALQIMPLITQGTFEVIENDFIKKKSHYLLDLANRCFKAKGNWIKIIQYGEVEAIATALYHQVDTIVIDERITRKLIEDPKDVRETLRKRLHTKIHVDQDNLDKFFEEVKHLKVIRSIELVTVAYELGLLERYIENSEHMVIENLRDKLLEGVLWGVKLNGCSVNKEEIDEIKKIEDMRVY